MMPRYASEKPRQDVEAPRERPPLTISEDALAASDEGGGRRKRKIVPRPYNGYVGSFSDQGEPQR